MEKIVNFPTSEQSTATKAISPSFLQQSQIKFSKQTTSINHQAELESGAHLQSINNRMYDSFHYTDQVTFQKMNVKNLRSKRIDYDRLHQQGQIHKLNNGKSKSCQDLIISNQNSSKQRKQRKWCHNKAKKANSKTEDADQQIEQQKGNLNYFMVYLEEIRRIKMMRNSQLAINWRDKNYKNQNRSRAKFKKYLYCQSNAKHYRGQDEDNVLRNSVEERVLKQKKIINDMKKRIYEINIQQFRKYYANKQKFNPHNQRLLDLPENVRKCIKVIPIDHHRQNYVIDLENLNEEDEKNRENLSNFKNRFKSKSKKRIQQKQARALEQKFSNQCENFKKLIKMRIRHETQFNWEKRKGS